MKLTFRRQTIRPRHRFSTSQGGIDEKETLVVSIEHDGVVGLGEVVATSLYGQSLEASEAALARVEPLLGDDPLAIEPIVARLIANFDSQRAMIAGVDSALHDLAARKLGVPVWRLLGLERPRKQTTFTIGVAEPELIRVKVQEALDAHFDALKIKVGTKHDHQTLDYIRGVFNGPLFLDANEAWDAATAEKHILALRKYKPTIIEQPVRRSEWRGMAALRTLGVAPIVADESCERPADVARLAGHVDGVNIKFTKCGGIREALRMIHLARGLGMKVMLGCFVCSSLAIAPALAIASLVDWADLDGHLLLADDPFEGLSREGGILTAPDAPGLGVRARTASV